MVDCGWEDRVAVRWSYPGDYRCTDGHTESIFPVAARGRPGETTHDGAGASSSGFRSLCSQQTRSVGVRREDVEGTVLFCCFTCFVFESVSIGDLNGRNAVRLFD